MKLLSEEDRKYIEEAVKKAESVTSGEIVFAITDASAHYHYATLQGAILCMAAATAIYLALPLTHTITATLWIEFISLALFYAILPHVPWRRLLIPKEEMEARVHEAAFMKFYSSGLYRTREENGIEIFLSLFEKRVVVIGDRGIHEKMGNAHWDDVRKKIIDGIHTGKPREGICAAIETCGESLAKHFPRRPDDINELPDHPLESRIGPEAP
jgi:putative membrane protein